MQNYSFVQILGIILGLTVGIGTLIILIIKMYRGKIKVKDVEFDMSDTQKAQCVDCDNRTRVIMMIDQILNYMAQKQNILSVEIIQLQMSKLEEHTITIKNECYHNALALLNKYLVNNQVAMLPIQHKDFLLYRLVFGECGSRVKDMIRIACLKNGFYSMNVTEYENFINEKASLMMNIIVETFTLNYLGGEFLTSDILLQSLDKQKMYFEDKLKLMFNDFIDIQARKQKEIKVIDDKIKDLMKNQIG